MARRLDRVGRGLGQSGTAAPELQLAGEEQVAAIDRERERSVRRRRDLSRIRAQPERLGARDRGRADAGGLAGRLGELPGLVEQFLRARVAAPRPDEAEHGERVDVRSNRVAANAENRCGGLGGLIPVPLDEQEPRPKRQEVVAVELEAVLLDEGDPRFEMPARDVVPPAGQRRPEQRRVHTADRRGVAQLPAHA